MQWRLRAVAGPSSGGEILTTVRKAISVPFTCKFRAGWNDHELVAVKMAQLAEECGLQAVALHPRTREQGTPERPIGHVSPK